MEAITSLLACATMLDTTPCTNRTKKLLTRKVSNCIEYSSYLAAQLTWVEIHSVGLAVVWVRFSACLALGRKVNRQAMTWALCVMLLEIVGVGQALDWSSSYHITRGNLATHKGSCSVVAMKCKFFRHRSLCVFIWRPCRGSPCQATCAGVGAQL